MAKSITHRLGALQLKILKSLWASGEATVAVIHEQVDRRGTLAYTTIATMLRKMEAKGMLTHRVEGRSFVYRALIKESEVSRSLTHDLLDRMFGGSLSSMVSHLLEEREVSNEDLDRLQDLINQRKGKK